MKRTLSDLALLCVALVAAPISATGATNTNVSTTGSPKVYVAFDVETTGLSSDKCRIVELAAVKFSSNTVISTRSWLINPGCSIPESARRIHGITDEMVKDKPAFAEVYPAFREFTAGCIVLAHNARFDMRFLNAEIERSRLASLENTVVDTLPLFRSWFPGGGSHALQSLAVRLKIEREGHPHRALADAELLARVFLEGLRAGNHNEREILHHALDRGPKPQIPLSGNGPGRS